MFYERSVKSQVEHFLFKGKVIILYGARQVGKTTLTKSILEKFKTDGRYLNCELLSNIQALETTDQGQLKNFLGNYKIIVLDEAQKVRNIGLILKILIDTFPEIQIIATGSSSFDLANKTAEALTGRAVHFQLFPFSLKEISQKYDLIEIKSRLEQILRFGLYPGVFDQPDELAKTFLEEIASAYLFKDLLEFDGIKKSDILLKLLQLLALQLGNQVSFNELAQTLGINVKTVERYLDLLEKCFVIFRLRSFSRNLRKELSKSFKVYFYDLGIRNSLIQSFTPLHLRTDTGALWENFCIMERIKLNQSAGKKPNIFFWRTYDQKELDYLEEQDGKILGFEFKWNNAKKRSSVKDFTQSYPGSAVKVINRENFNSFLL